MKKLWPVALAVLIGCGLAFLMFRGVEKRTMEEVEGNAVAIQIGVFTNRDNAESMKNSIGGVVLEDNGLYRVYYSVLRNVNNIDYITNYLKSIGVSYYLKKITISESVANEVDNMEVFMDKTSGEAKIRANEQLLGTIKEVI